MLETFSEFNKFARTILAGVVIAGVGYGGGWLYTNLHPDARVKEREKEIAEIKTALSDANTELASKDAVIQQLDRNLVVAQQQIDRLDTAMRLLKVTHRLADIEVLRQAEDPQTGKLISEISFQETDDEGNPIDVAKRMSIEGDLVYVDYWIVKFDDQYVEQADVDRSTSICLFRRIFGEYQEPSQGFVLDESGTRPNAYGRGPASDFEKKIWSDFWNIADDPERAASLGIRALHGEAVSSKLRPGRRYRVELRASGGLSIKPIVDDAS